MTVQDLRDFHVGVYDRQIAKIYGVSPTTFCLWKRRGIPDGRQAMIEIQSGGKLKASTASTDYS